MDDSSANAPARTPGVAPTAREPGMAPVTRGILYMMAGAAIISANDAVIKYLAASGIHPIEIVFFRNLFGALAFFPFYARLGIGALKTNRFGFHLAKNALQTTSIVAYFWSLAYIQLADAAALGFMAPVFASIGAIVFMREPSRLMRWVCIAIGVAGMLIIVRPGFAEVNIGVWMVVGATVVGSVCRLMTKSLIRTDSAATIVLYLSITVTVLTFVPALFVWTWLSLEQWLLFAAIGASGSATHWLFTAALKHGDVTVMEPVSYTRLVWAALFGIVVFGQVPGVATWVGGIIIIVGAMLLLRVETMEKRRNSNAQATP